MREDKNEVLVKSIYPLKDAKGKEVTFIVAEPKFSVPLVIPQPDYVKFLVSEKWNESVIGTVINPSDGTEIMYFHMLPEGHDSWTFMGSDGNSGTMLYGNKADILKADEMLQYFLLSNISKHSSDEFNTLEFNYMVWHLENENSLMIVYHNADSGIQLPAGIQKLPLIHIIMGDIADDILGDEVILSGILKEVKNIYVGSELDEDFVEEVSEWEHEKDFLSYAGKPMKRAQLPMLMELAKVMLCDFFKYHTLPNKDNEESEGDDYINNLEIIEVAKRVIRYFEIQATELPVSASDKRVTFEEDGSSKEYTVTLRQQGDDWVVDATYGPIGKKLKTIQKLSTGDFAKAQETYRNILIEKLKEGYK